MDVAKMAVLSVFRQKNDLGPLGVNSWNEIIALDINFFLIVSSFIDYLYTCPEIPKTKEKFCTCCSKLSTLSEKLWAT